MAKPPVEPLPTVSGGSGTGPIFIVPSGGEENVKDVDKGIPGLPTVPGGAENGPQEDVPAPPNVD